MYKNKSLKKSFDDNNSEDDFDFCNTETGQKFAIKWSPSEEVKLISKHRFNGSRPISRSVPRRKRSLFQYRINRSLNFEIGTPRHDAVFKSPNFDSEDGQICNEKYLTRSAKILRSLNINFSPSNSRKKKINKTLNFDLSPSPKRIFSSSESIYHKESPEFDSNVNRIPKINKTLNFSSSSNGSHLSNYLGSSIDSIDENQNQTPSHRNKNVKKSLNYLTPSPKLSSNAPRVINKTPMSREEFINNLKYNAETPDARFSKECENKSKHFEGICISTPRNLFQDFEDDDKEMRPVTPENVVQFVPESMSAIKKSHKKQRRSNRLEKLCSYELQEHCDQIGNSSEDPIVLSHTGERPATPITNDSYPSPNYSIGSIKQSHKKDKSKKKSAVVHSEDEISDSGSIFDYSELTEKKPDTGNEVLANSSPLNSSSGSSGFGVMPFEKAKNRPICFDNSVEEFSDHGSIFDYSETPETKPGANMDLSCQMDQLSHDHQATDKEALKLPLEKLELISPVKQESLSESGANEGRPVTPENVINVLDQVMSDSIKKSHKKLKDKNKKTLLTHQIFVEEPAVESPDQSIEDEQGSSLASDRQTPESVSRAGTPENVNSSRLLLGQYSSVKKSHKKNKHMKIVTEFEKRQRFFNSDDQRQASDDSTRVSGVKTLLSPPNSLMTNASKRRKAICVEPLTAAAATGMEKCSTTTPDKHSVEFSTSEASPLERSTPNKRKKSFSLNETGTSNSSIDLSNIESSSMEYESAEEEFKIFTPIKKRRSLRGPIDVEERRPTCLELKDPPSLETTDANCGKQDQSFESMENTFATPPNHSRDNNSEPKVCVEVSDGGNSNGRSTPLNRSTSELIFDINSIKKSHKKDKRNSRLRRTLNIEDEKNDFRVIGDEGVNLDGQKSIGRYQTLTPDDSTVENDLESSKPSTSFEGNRTEAKMNENVNTETIKTPPNCFRVVNYLKLRQADSIKRSHKKIREQKRLSAIDTDPDLSDDGSLFDSSDRIGTNELDDSIEKIEDNRGIDVQNEAGNENVDDTSQTSPQTPPNRPKLLIQIESIKKSHKKVREYKRKDARDVSEETSGGGSIFDPESESLSLD